MLNAFLLVRAHVVEFADEQAEVGAVYSAVLIEVSMVIVAANGDIAIESANQCAEVGAVYAVVVVGIAGGKQQGGSGVAVDGVSGAE